MSEKYSTIELIAWLIPYFGKRHHDMHMDAIIAKLRDGDNLSSAAIKKLNNPSDEIVSEEFKKAIADYEEGK